MANRDLHKSMGNCTCGWVRVRLPLLVGNRDEDQTRDGRTGGDLTPEEHRQIEHHLSGCAPCTDHWTGLEQALLALRATAASVPVQLNTPSLWPRIERRINDHRTRAK